MSTIEQLEQINKEIRDSEWNRDTEYMQKLLAEDLLFRRASGALVTKESYIKSLMDTNNVYTQLDNSSITTDVNEKEDKAISVVMVNAAGEKGVDKKPFEGNFKNIRFFRKTDDGWQLYLWYNEKV